MRHLTVILFQTLLLALLPTYDAVAGMWPKGSNAPFEALTHPTIQSRERVLEYQLESGFQFIAYGDQRALADGEWQAMVEHIAAFEASPSAESPTLFVLDTGDIVLDGRQRDQFGMLAEILQPIGHLPYLVSVGNHEIHANSEHKTREDLATFLGKTIEGIDADQLYYRVDTGPLRMLFLDSNDLVYGRPYEADPQARGREQLEWLAEQLSEEEGRRHTIVVLHHPLLQSAKMHRDSAAELWNLEFDGRHFADFLADGSVDLILTGHTHTYESFHLQRDDGASLWHVNLSGRPRNAWWIFGAGRRRPKDLHGEEMTWLLDHGWSALEHWDIEQVDAMLKDERNQFGVFRLSADGSLSLSLGFIDKKSPHALSWGEKSTLLPALGK